MSVINFVKGKWYKLTSNSSKEIFYLKFYRDNNGKFWASEYISSSRYCDQEGWLSINGYRIENVSFGEIKKYLPDGHKDLKRSNINNI